ncbi:DUF5819 family protein [Streptomyces sp. NPDC005805]|uniref:DUF5819 family protein n=1 Tax=Streptomyces sp. NPDC005805 TaxID=3157068 RepID=UPI00340670D0
MTPAAGSGGEGPDAARASRPEAGDGAAPVAGSAGPGAGSGAGAEQADRESAAPDAEGRAARGGAAGPAEAGDGAAPVAGSAGPGAGSGAAEGGGIAGLRLPYQIAAAICGVLVVGVACVHLGMVFLHVAPSNTVTKKHGDSVQWWVYPEFEQNWKLFAPNPLQQNISVQVRAEYTDAGGNRRTSDWIDLTGQDGEAIRGNLFPSHVHQNQLRRGWDFYVGAHADGQRADGVRARLSERYIRRIAMQRLDREDLGQVQRIQMRSESRAIRPPAWSTEKVDTRPVHNVLPWWTVTGADLPGGVDNLPAEAAR